MTPELARAADEHDALDARDERARAARPDPHAVDTPDRTAAHRPHDASDAMAAPLPLAGVRVAVTRAPEDALGLRRALAALGAVVVETPLVRVHYRTESWLGERTLADYEWLAFTSRHAVAATMATAAAQLDALRVHRRTAVTPRLAAVGAATAAALGEARLPVDLVPPRADADALADALLDGRCPPGARVLFPRAAEARQTLPRRLRAAGVNVDDVVLYEVVPDRHGAARLLDLLVRGEVDVVTLASGSAVRHLLDHIGPTVAARAALVTIGPTTSAAVRDGGLAVAAEAADARPDALAAAVVAAGRRPPAPPSSAP